MEGLEGGGGGDGEGGSEGASPLFIIVSNCLEEWHNVAVIFITGILLLNHNKNENISHLPNGATIRDNYQVCVEIENFKFTTDLRLEIKTKVILCLNIGEKKSMFALQTRLKSHTLVCQSSSTDSQLIATLQLLLCDMKPNSYLQPLLRTSR